MNSPFYIRYAKQPMLFRELGGKKVASPVPVSMATKFTTREAAYARALEQWPGGAATYLTISELVTNHDEPVPAPKAVAKLI